MIQTGNFYRLVEGNVTVQSFLSNAAKGQPLLDARYEAEWRGVSVWATKKQAARRSSRWGQTGARIYLSEFELPQVGSVLIKRTTAQRGHHLMGRT